MQLKKMMISALYGALLFVLKMAAAWIPNGEPVTLLVLLAALCFGKSGLFSVGIYLVLELMAWGFGWWSLSYFYVWLLWFGFALLFRKQSGIWFWTLSAAGFGLLFGSLSALVMLVPLGWNGTAAWIAAGLPFDLAHGLMNGLLTFLLLRPLGQILSRLAKQAGFHPAAWLEAK